jgi:hypothetical protein
MKMTSDSPKRYPLRLWLTLAPYVLLYPAAPVIKCIFPERSMLWPLTLDVPLMLFLAVSHSSSSLLGVWVGFSGTAIWRRILGAAVGISYVALAVPLAAWLGPAPGSRIVDVALTFFVVFLLQVLGVAGSLVVIRRFGTCLCLLDEDSRQRYRERFQFSLRSLKGLVFAVSVLFATISTFRVYHSEIIFVVIVEMSAIAITLATVWVGLGQGRPLLRIVPVVCGAICLGLIISSAFTSVPLVHAV